MTDEAKALVERCKGHTQGPWRVDGPPHNQIVWNGPESRICFMAHSNGVDNERDIATGSLVAAAPELLDLIETQAREIERLREALEREPKAWLIADEETAWVTLFKPNPNDHPWGDVIPLYSAALAGDSHDQ